MLTTHKFIYNNSKQMNDVKTGSIDLVVTSPPYPMIEMWDEVFSKLSRSIAKSLANKDGSTAFELMHRQLDIVWKEVFRVLKPGGIACINIGDAARTINSHFALYTNHARILNCLQRIGFSSLPAIIWRKQTNAPNKFMGSGMLPPGAYVTLEHEYILILRKGNKREFRQPAEKKIRAQSAYFWEERNHWFSDVWMDLKGTSQSLFDNKSRRRSGAFPFELPYRLISMFSVKGDTVLDPFMGLGTTLFAAMATGRNSLGYEIDPWLEKEITSRIEGIVDFSNRRVEKRLEDHLAFAAERIRTKGAMKYLNQPYLFPVMTRQEIHLMINELISVSEDEQNILKAIYSRLPQKKITHCWRDWEQHLSEKQK